MFSGSALNEPSVAATDEILNGNGTQAGLTQVIAAAASRPTKAATDSAG